MMTRSAGARPEATSASRRVTLWSGATEKRVRDGGMRAVEHQQCHHASGFKGEALPSVFELHVLLPEKWLQFVQAEVGQDLAVPIEDRGLGLMRNDAHLLKGCVGR